MSPGESMPLLQATYLTKSFQKRKMLNVFIFVSHEFSTRSLTLNTVIAIVICIVFVNIYLSMYENGYDDAVAHEPL